MPKVISVSFWAALPVQVRLAGRKHSEPVELTAREPALHCSLPTGHSPAHDPKDTEAAIQLLARLVQAIAPTSPAFISSRRHRP